MTDQRVSTQSHNRVFSLSWPIQHASKFMRAKICVNIRKELNSNRTGLGQQHHHRFFVLNTTIGLPWRHVKTFYFCSGFAKSVTCSPAALNHRKTHRRGHCRTKGSWSDISKIQGAPTKESRLLFQILSFNSLNRAKNGWLEDFFAGFENPYPSKTYLPVYF